MRRRTSRVLLGVAVILASRLASGQEEINIEKGRQRFMEICYRCHPLGPSDAHRIAASIPRVSIDAFLAGLWNQSPNMLSAFEAQGWQPELLSREDMIQIFSFTQVLADRPGGGDHRRGERFVESNQCLACHFIGDRGNPGGVGWDRFASTLSPNVVMSAVWAHRLGMIGAYQAKGVPLPRFERGELSDLIAFMRYLGNPQKPVPLLLDMREVRIAPELFERFRCRRCHRLSEFAGKTELGLDDITEALLAHAFMPQFSRSPLKEITMSPADSMALATVVHYYTHLDQPGDPTTGKRVFLQQGCFNCHDEPGETDLQSQKTPIGTIADEWDLAMQVFNKVPRMVQKARVEAKAFPRLTRLEIRHLFAYICSASPECRPLIEAGTR